MNLKYKLMILTAGILALTSSLLTALGMAELFQGLFIVFLVCTVVLIFGIALFTIGAEIAMTPMGMVHVFFSEKPQ